MSDYTRAMNSPKQHRTIRSFVLRQGRMTPAQTRAIDTLLPVYGLDPKATFNYQEIFKNDLPVVIEIGFGMGDSLVAMATANPNINYIGIEVHGPGVGTCLDMIAKAEITNLRIVQHDAVEVLNYCIADQSLAGVQIFFPDPWHKKRHHKRRLIQPEFVQRLVTKLATKGFIHLATDWQHYAEQMLVVLNSNDDLINQADHDYVDGTALRPNTKFEARGQRLGHGVWDLCFTKR